MKEKKPKLPDPRRLAQVLRSELKRALTAEEVAACAEHHNGQRNITAINMIFRDQDDSDKYPVNGRFDATQRAIRRVRRSGHRTGGLDYAHLLDATISEIVNGEV